jgi:hypothetical protein
LIEFLEGLCSCVVMDERGVCKGPMQSDARSAQVLQDRALHQYQWVVL